MRGKLVVLAWLFWIPVIAQGTQPDTATEESPFLQRISRQSAIEDQRQTTGDTSSLRRKLIESRQAALVAEQEADAAQSRFRRATYEYYIRSLDYRDRVYNWQQTSAIVTFVIVILVVLTGLVFSGIQFRIAMKEADLRYEIRRKQRFSKTPAAEAAAVPEESATSLELSMQGVKASSSILGVIILIVSLAFFYLYLVYVFPISEFKMDASGAKAEKQVLESPAVDEPVKEGAAQ